MSAVGRFPTVLELPSGLKLQVSMTFPQLRTLPDGKKLAVCSHPWSRLGGSMHDPVLHSLVGPLSSKLGYHVLLFNSRGVGSSSGWASFTGLQEAQDLQELVTCVVQRLGSVKDVALIGYSNGCLSTSIHPLVSAPPVRTSHVLISYPLDVRGWLSLFNGRTYQAGFESLMCNPESRILVIFGDRDEFTGMSSYDRWIQRLQRIATHGQTRTEVGSSLRTVRIGGGTHFWRGDDLTRMIAAVEEFLQMC
ncbi:Alpha/Beta hydrolase protein [Vararia minispora EC-137]|uniref:Alpha/Beta hydrolase protein n=1 Tax=Vararia minispora EC-137 TaxID=1314806 RepID=A0ACB8QNW8_9AGAM|nr:Alpha/Beta hydrolase protein [Vararia minispora EC-137]